VPEKNWQRPLFLSGTDANGTTSDLNDHHPLNKFTFLKNKKGSLPNEAIPLRALRAGEGDRTLDIHVGNVTL
jgi:hypothetical protein